MSAQKDIQKLQREFPDLTQSVLGDVLTSYKNDKEKAAFALRGISDELKAENEKKIQELKEMFPTLSNQVIGEELEKCKGNVDSAIAPLFSKTEELQKKEKKKQDVLSKKKRQEDEAKRRKEEEKKQANNLMEIFKTIPQEKVQQVLDENEGDIEETTAQLLLYVAKHEEITKANAKQAAKQKADEEDKKKKQEQELRMKELKFQALKDKFEDLSDEKVTAVLNSTDWDIKKALAELYVVSLGQKKKEIKDVFGSVRDEDIEMALEDNNHDKIKAVNALTSEREKRKLKAEAKSQLAKEKRDKKKKKRLEDKKKTIEKKKKQSEKQSEKPTEIFKKKEEDTKNSTTNSNSNSNSNNSNYTGYDKLESPKKTENTTSVQTEQVVAANAAPVTQQLQPPQQQTQKVEENDYEDSVDESFDDQDQDQDEEVEVEPEVEDEAPLITQQVVISKVKQNALERSMILGQMIEQEIAETQKDEERLRKEQKQAVQALFRNNLENIIEKQARDNSLPGMMPPPLPKQIDNILGKNKPGPIVEPEQTLNLSTKELPHPSQSQSQSQTDSNAPKALVTLTVKQPLVDVGNPIVVDWEIASGVSSAWDWVGLFPVDKPNKQYVTYQWSGKQLMKGSLTFTAPNVYGEYEFRFFPNGYYEHATMSNRVKVGPQIELTGTLDKPNNRIIAKWNQISGNLYSKSWIGLYEKSETNNNNYVHFEYAGKPNSEVVFDAPFKPREYELRFFTNSYVDVSRSNSIRIEGNDTMSASYENGQIKVKLNVVTIDPYYESGWLGVYFISEQNNRQWRRYKYFSSRIGDCEFKAPRTPGQYEVRMFANKTYDMILKSNVFTIPPPSSTNDIVA